MNRIQSIFLAIILLRACAAWAIDLQPNDIVAPPPNKNYLTLSYVNTETATVYRNGAPVTAAPYSNPILGTQGAILRGATTYSLGDVPGVSYIQLPYATASPSGSLSRFSSDSGIGDLTLATAFWPYANRSTRTYLGIAGYLISPTGNYSSQRAFNVSENRFRTDLQIGFQTPITDRIDGMVAVDTMWFGDNTQCGQACVPQNNTTATLSQKPLTTTQFGPIYRLNEIFTFGASYFFITGGATSISGSYQNNSANTQKYLLSAQAHTGIGRISLQYGRDTVVSNGFMQNRVLALRLMREF